MQLDDEKADAREVSARPCETGYETGHDRIVAAGEDDRDLGRRVFCSECCEVPAACCDHINLAADEVCGQSWQPVINPLGPAVFDRYVLPLDIAGLAQS